MTWSILPLTCAWRLKYWSNKTSQLSLKPTLIQIHFKLQVTTISHLFESQLEAQKKMAVKKNLPYNHLSLHLNTILCHTFEVGNECTCTVLDYFSIFKNQCYSTTLLKKQISNMRTWKPRSTFRWVKLVTQMTEVARLPVFCLVY